MKPESYLSENSAEYYLYENQTKNKIIYKTTLTAIFVIIISLPFIWHSCKYPWHNFVV